jgi:hypothetical protein
MESLYWITGVEHPPVAVAAPPVNVDSKENPSVTVMSLGQLIATGGKVGAAVGAAVGGRVGAAVTLGTTGAAVGGDVGAAVVGGVGLGTLRLYRVAGEGTVSVTTMLATTPKMKTQIMASSTLS